MATDTPIDFSRCIAPLFVTPVVNYLWEDSADLNAALQTHIQSLQESTPTLNRSNVGGWHSALDFLDNEVEAVATLRGRLHGFVEQMLVEFAHPGTTSSFHFEGWANVLCHGQYHSVHSHPNAAWSGVYYVTGNEQVAGQEFSGKLELLDPRPGVNLTYAEQSNLYERILLDPRAGQMVLFPSWLMHQVHPYFGEQERISIAFNVTVE